MQEPVASSGLAPVEPPALPVAGQPADAADEPPPPPPAPVGPPRRRIHKKAVGPKDLDPVEDAKVVDLLGYFEPSFDFSKMRGRLKNPEVTTSEKVRIILGFHIRFWHAPR